MEENGDRSWRKTVCGVLCYFYGHRRRKGEKREEKEKDFKWTFYEGDIGGLGTKKGNSWVIWISEGEL